MEDNRKRYSCICPECGKEFFVCKSIAQDMGMESLGMGSCFFCDAFLNLKFDSENEKMTAIKWGDYIKDIT